MKGYTYIKSIAIAASFFLCAEIGLSQSGAYSESLYVGGEEKEYTLLRPIHGGVHKDGREYLEDLKNKVLSAIDGPGEYGIKGLVEEGGYIKVQLILDYREDVLLNDKNEYYNNADTAWGNALKLREVFNTQITSSSLTAFSSNPIRAYHDDLKARLPTYPVCRLIRPSAPLFSTNLWESSIVRFFRAYFADGIQPVDVEKYLYNKCWFGQLYMPDWDMPIILKATIKKARLDAIKLPYYGYEYSGKMFDEKGGNQIVEVYVNGQKKAEEIMFSSLGDVAEEKKVIDVELGDSISFLVKGAYDAKPDIKGVPNTWIARFAGDVMYYCTPSVKPGNYHPWIGYDSRIHNLMVRKFPEGFVQKVPDWKRDSATGEWSWGFAAQRETKDQSKYISPIVYEWGKWHTVGGVHQRRNQKEGVNMQYLTYWKNWKKSSFTNYDNDSVLYMLGYDDDELGYFGIQDHKADKNIADHTIYKLENLPWKTMPEGENILFDAEGYPKSGSVLNEVVKAYLINRSSVNKEDRLLAYNKDNGYRGYEIQDIHTSEDQPYGDASGNQAQRGEVSVSLGLLQASFVINATPPLYNYKGFYASIVGPAFPAMGEEGIEYQLKGVRSDIPDGARYILEYEYMDRLGNLSRSTRILTKDTIMKRYKEEKDANLAYSYNWINTFNLVPSAYGSITAYYQRTPTSERVMIAGKELKPIFLLMLGMDSVYYKSDPTSDKWDYLEVSEGDGHGVNIFQEEFRQNKSEANGYTKERRFGTTAKYAKQQTRRYVFPPRTKITFATNDGDPHLVFTDEKEYYLGSRQIANRVSPSDLDGVNSNHEPYLEFYLNGTLITSGSPYFVSRNGRKITLQFKEEGEFELTATYRKTSSISHLIKIIDYDKNNEHKETAPKKGLVKKYDLPSRYAAWLGITDASNYSVLEVTDVYSVFKYDTKKGGYRAFNGKTVKGKPNRWANANDYAENYIFRIDESIMKGNGEDIDMVGRFLEDYEIEIKNQWFWETWALHYSSNWLRMGGPGSLQTLPPYVDNSKVTRVDLSGKELWTANQHIHMLFEEKLPASWQYVVPLVSYTEYQGYRVRTNPSCIYNLEDLFNNETGAFSGNPSIPQKAEEFQAPDYSDEYKDKQDFYYALKGNRIFIYDNRKYPSNITSSKVVTVYNANPDKSDAQQSLKFINSISLNENISRPRRSISTDNSSSADSSSVVFPVPNNGNFTVRAGTRIGGTIKNVKLIGIHSNNEITIYDNNGSLPPRGELLLSVGAPIANGSYILRIAGYNGRVENKLIIINNNNGR